MTSCRSSAARLKLAETRSGPSSQSEVWFLVQHTQRALHSQGNPSGTINARVQLQGHQLSRMLTEKGCAESVKINICDACCPHISTQAYETAYLIIMQLGVKAELEHL